MTTEEYKKFIVHKPGTANNCDETGQIINCSIEFLKAKHIPERVKTEYLVRLKDELKQLSSSGFDYVQWCNIQCAILCLRRFTNKKYKK